MARPEESTVPPRQDASILHVDMDAFFLSVELREHPELRGVPAAVAGRSMRSVVLSASYEARAYGVRSAMPLAHARALCPPLRVVPPRQDVYRAVSAEVMALFGEVTPVMEPLSVDEAFLDVAGARRLLGPPDAVARMLRERVRGELGLPCTVGGAGVKFVAKMASTAAKPDGLLLVPPEQTLAFLHPRPVEHLWGIGPRAAERLHTLGVDTIGDLARADPAWLRARFGVAGQSWSELARGRDPRPVAPRAAAKSIGADHTFDADPTDRAELHRELLRLSHHVGGRLRREGTAAGAVTVRVKAPDGQVRSRTARLDAPTASGQGIVGPARRTLDELLTERPHPVRLLGVRAERLGAGEREAPAQGSLFDDLDAVPGEQPGREAADWEQAEATLDAVARRFPGAALRPASLLPPHAPAEDEGGRPGPVR